MNEQLTQRDWETISAYLDGQISGRNLARFESRLAREPHLQTALNEIAAARHVLRNTPRLRVPRNFTLTPAMVGQTAYRQARRKARFAPFFGWATAAITLLLVLVLAGDFFRMGATAPVAIEAARAEPEMQEVALDSAITAPAATDLPLLDAPAAGGVTEMQPGTAEESTAPEVAAVPQEPEPTLAAEQIFGPAAAPTAAPEESIRSAEPVTGTMFHPAAGTEITATATLTATEAPAEVSPESAAADSTTGQSEPPPEAPPAPKTAPPEATPAASITPPPVPAIVEAEANTASSATAEAEARAAPSQPPTAKAMETPPFNVWREVKIVLLFAALGTGMVWLYLRRRGI